MPDVTTLPAVVNGFRAARPGDVEWTTAPAESAPAHRPAGGAPPSAASSFSPVRSTFDDAMTNARRETQVSAAGAGRTATGDETTAGERTAGRTTADGQTGHGSDRKRGADAPRPEPHPDRLRKSAGNSPAGENRKTQAGAGARASEDSKRPQSDANADDRRSAADPVAADPVAADRAGEAVGARPETDGGSGDGEPLDGEKTAPASAGHGTIDIRAEVSAPDAGEGSAGQIAPGAEPAASAEPATGTDPAARTAPQPLQERPETNAAARPGPKESGAAHLADPASTSAPKAVSGDPSIPADRTHPVHASPATAGENFAAHLAEARSLLANHASRPADASMRSAPGATYRDSIPVPVNDPSFPGRFAASIALLGGAGIERAEIQLHPRELGPIRIELSMSGEAARIAFSAAHPDTRHAIEQSLPVLKDLLAERGLQLGGANVSDGRDGGRREASAGTAPPAGAATGDVPRGDDRDDRETAVHGNVRRALLSIYA